MWLPAAWLLLDVNKLRKDAAVQFLYLIGLGRLNEALVSLPLTARPIIHAFLVEWTR